jgi:hypothetical protein
MSARTTECPCHSLFYKPTQEERIMLSEVAVMTRLLNKKHHDPWTRPELERDIGGDMLDLSDALVNLTEQLVTVSRAARRTAELAELF